MRIDSDWDHPSGVFRLHRTFIVDRKSEGIVIFVDDRRTGIETCDKRLQNQDHDCFVNKALAPAINQLRASLADQPEGPRLNYNWTVVTAETRLRTFRFFQFLRPIFTYVTERTLERLKEWAEAQPIPPPEEKPKQQVSLRSSSSKRH
jgi:hypothetical protein